MVLEPAPASNGVFIETACMAVGPGWRASCGVTLLAVKVAVPEISKTYAIGGRRSVDDACVHKCVRKEQS